MNGFERHGITHLSPSSLNLWRESPGIWTLRYLRRIKDEGVPVLWRGKAVEDGLSALLRGRSYAEACQIAHQSYELNAQGELSAEIETERSLIAPMLSVLNLWRPPSELMATQIKVEHWFDGVSVPVIGYVDCSFECRDIDLKTTKALPSSPRPDNVRQAAFYRAARRRPGGLLYVTNKKYAYYEISDAQMVEAISDLENDAHTLAKFLARVESADDALNILPLDRSHYLFPKAHRESTDDVPILMAG